MRFQLPVVEERFERIAGVARLWDHQRIGGNLCDGRALLGRQRVPGRRDDHQLVAVDHHALQPVVGHRQRDDAKIHGVLHDRLQDLRVVRALDADSHVGIVTFELREDLGQDVQAGAFVGAYDDRAARHVLGFGDGRQYRFAGLDRLFGIFHKQFPGDCQRDPAAGTVEQSGTDLFFERANLR